MLKEKFKTRKVAMGSELGSVVGIVGAVTSLAGLLYPFFISLYEERLWQRRAKRLIELADAFGQQSETGIKLIAKAKSVTEVHLEKEKIKSLSEMSKPRQVVVLLLCSAFPFLLGLLLFFSDKLINSIYSFMNEMVPQIGFLKAVAILLCVLTFFLLVFSVSYAFACVVETVVERV